MALIIDAIFTAVITIGSVINLTAAIEDGRGVEVLSHGALLGLVIIRIALALGVHISFGAV